MCASGSAPVVLTGAVVEENAQVGAGAVVPQGKVVPAGWLVMGVPRQADRKMSDEELADIRRNAVEYRRPLAPGLPRRLGRARPEAHAWPGMKPLAGLRVIDFTQAMAAPYCTMNLADLGADVIKLEPPGEGEPTRHLGAVHKRGHSATFMTMNRGKRDLAVDLKQPEGVALVRRLVKTADVFVQNYRPGVAERLGLGYRALSEVNPRLIYCAVSGFGGTGPYASRGGYDLIAQGMSGVISVTGDEDGPPAKSGVPLSDLAAGLFSAYGILCALEYRDRTGEGPARRYLPARGGHGAHDVGGHGILGDRGSPEGARLGSPPLGPLSGAARRRRLLHGGRQQRPPLRRLLPGHRPRGSSRGFALRHGRCPAQEPQSADRRDREDDRDRGARVLARAPRQGGRAGRPHQQLRRGARRSADARAPHGRWT
jgi:hypothetical protein